MIKVGTKSAIEIGSKVTIQMGPLKGIAGVVNGRPRPGRFSIHIEFIAARASVEIDAANLRINSAG